MQRFAAVFSYDGADFFGFQVQPTIRTVQGVFEEALERIHKTKIITEGAGRTDTGVHGYGQVIAFNSTLDRLTPEIMRNALNANLPNDIYVRKVIKVPYNFSPRFAAKKRIYHYFIHNSPEPDLFVRKYVWWFPYNLDLEKMRQAAGYLLGEHDFSSFKTGNDERSPIRTINNIRIIRKNRNTILVRVEGISFLKRMVRNVVGTLVRIGTGSLEPDKMKDILEARNRTSLPASAPPQGLVFYKVIFDDFET